jgi:sulfur carrier protein
VTIWVNGQPREVPEGMTLAALLTSMEVGTTGVAVEVNAEVVRRARHPEFQLSPQDRVEVVTFVGGG